MANFLPLKLVLGKLKQFALTDTVPTNNLGTGIANATTFLRGDQTWQSAIPFNSNQYSAGGTTVIGTTTYTHTYTGLIVGKNYFIQIQSFASKSGGAVSGDISADITGCTTTWGSLTTVGRQNYAMATGEIYIFESWIMVTATSSTIAVSVNGTFTGSGTPTFTDVSTTIEQKS